ncbi:ParA family partition ATPase [Microvirga mediterraneensis]|uniref:AAA family ATPase n=1 Tax=Microvirga mediterraneensis TaxID=2754695 RepID=A0A838BXP9_9HYPH|nr:ParA family partition ATPase [Microvirga mediterraneensis]MBA1159346.1 AAA family ATPase [Microvirga mediterraneensis]
MILGVLNQKGGVGKTSLATNLAHTYATQGARVLLVDADPQSKSATRWSSAREIEQLFPVIGMAKPTLHKDLPAVARNYDLTIIDGAPQLAEIGRSILLASDMIVIPVQPSPYDVWSAADTVDLIREARVFKENLKAVFVVNRKIANTAIGRDVTEALAQHEIPTLKTHLVQRVVYAESAAQGLAVEEMEPDSQAAKEIRQVASEIRRAGDNYEAMLATVADTIGNPDG